MKLDKLEIPSKAGISSSQQQEDVSSQRSGTSSINSSKAAVRVRVATVSTPALGDLGLMLTEKSDDSDDNKVAEGLPKFVAESIELELHGQGGQLRQAELDSLITKSNIVLSEPEMRAAEQVYRQKESVEVVND